MNAKQVLGITGGVIGLVLLLLLALSSSVTAYNSFHREPAKVVYVDRSPAKRHSCGCIEGKCECCDSCTCKQHQHGDAEKPSGLKYEPTGSKPLGEKQ